MIKKKLNNNFFRLTAKLWTYSVFKSEASWYWLVIILLMQISLFIGVIVWLDIFWMIIFALALLIIQIFKALFKLFGWYVKIPLMILGAYLGILLVYNFYNIGVQNTMHLYIPKISGMFREIWIYITNFLK